MENDYSLILKMMNYGYSKITSFENCPHSFLLQYVLDKETKPNFFGEYGTFIHEVVEKYFKKEIKKEDLVQYYIDNYNKTVISSAPLYPMNMSGNYYNDRLDFFSNMNFDIDKYNVISIEETINFVYNDIEITIRPDIILQNKETGKYILVDLKTHKLKGNKKQDEADIENYLNQGRLYCYGFWLEKNIQISEIFIWFVRNRIIMSSKVDTNKIMNTMEWFEESVKTIQKENKWEANLTKKNDYFCKNICSTYESCCPKQEQK